MFTSFQKKKTTHESNCSICFKKRPIFNYHSIHLESFSSELESFQDISKRLLKKLLNDNCKFTLFLSNETDVSGYPYAGQIFHFSSHLWCFKV